MRKCVFLIVCTGGQEPCARFTAYDVEGENFHLIVDDIDLADVSFKEHSIVEINLQTKEIKYGASSDIYDTRFLAPCAPFFSPLYL